MAKRRTKPPIDERYMDQKWFIDSHTICSELREVYNVIDNEYAKKRLRICATMAKAMASKLGRLRKGYDVTWECEKCGNCCKGFALDIQPKNVNLENITLLEIHDVPVKEGFTLFVPHRCKHLTDESLCDIWENRPQVCRNYFCEGEKRGPHHRVESGFEEDIGRIESGDGDIMTRISTKKMED